MKLQSRCLNSYLLDSRILPNWQYAYRKGLSTCDALLDISHLLQDALDKCREARFVPIDFSVAFDEVNHADLLHKLAAVVVRRGGGGFNFVHDRPIST